MKKVLIDNCVPLNNGDAALIMGLYKQLKAKNFSVAFSCLEKLKVEKKYPNFTWYKSHINTFFYKVCFKKNILVWFWKLVMFVKIVVLDNEYKQSDIIISAPGGYIHSYYGIEGRMYILYLCEKWLHKKVGIYSQSIGNLSRRDQRIFYKYGKSLNYIFARDSVSFERAKSYGDFTNIYLTKDAVFLLKESSGSETKSNSENNKVAISLRSWKHEGRDMQAYFDMMHSMVDYLLSGGYEITFLSTCQGIDGYVDDSKVASQFMEQFHYTKSKKVHVDSNYYNLRKLQANLRNFDYVIGTRLHMCLLSWINQVPAFNISYEEKGRESFSYMEIEQYSVDFNSQDAVGQLSLFLGMTNAEHASIISRVKEISDEQKRIFTQLVDSDFEEIT